MTVLSGAFTFSTFSLKPMLREDGVGVKALIGINITHTVPSFFIFRAALFPVSDFKIHT